MNAIEMQLTYHGLDLEVFRVVAQQGQLASFLTTILASAVALPSALRFIYPTLRSESKQPLVVLVTLNSLYIKIARQPHSIC